MPIKNSIKAILATKGMTMTDLVNALNITYDRNDSLANLSKKLSNNTIKYREVEEIAFVLNCDIRIIMQDTGKEF
ncbi:helix-turn-helix domain-containing protein [Anaerotignum faecicola]|jgi:DNA-binding Xre family transcriptional regulator